MNLINRNNTTALRTIAWWELNRILYNVYMLIIGFLSFFIGYMTIPLIYLIIGLSLNILFTTSWIGEILFIRPFKSSKLTRIYTKTFILVFYGYSSISVLLYIFVPELLDWTIDFWIQHNQI